MWHLLLSGLLLSSGLTLLLILYRSPPLSHPSRLLGWVSMALFLAMGTAQVFKLRLPPPAKAHEKTTPTHVSTPEASAANLKGVTFSRWQQKDPAWKQIAAEALLKDLRRQRSFVVNIRSDREFRPWAVALVRCLANASPTGDPLVENLAKTCVAQGDLQQYLP